MDDLPGMSFPMGQVSGVEKWSFANSRLQNAYLDGIPVVEVTSLLRLPEHIGIRFVLMVNGLIWAGRNLDLDLIGLDVRYDCLA